MTERLLEALSRDSMARLRWLVCRRLDIPAGSLRERLMSRRRVLAYACQMVLDGASPGPEANGGFDMERFQALRRDGK